MLEYQMWRLIWELDLSSSPALEAQRRLLITLQRSELETIVFAPLLHDLHEVLDLRIACILKHVDDLDETLLVLSSSHDHLEDSDGGSALALPELRVRVQPLKHIEGLDREVELAHLVAIVSDEVQKRKTLIRSLHINVDVPRQVRLLVHDVAPAKPAQIAIVLLVALVLHLQEAFFGLFILAGCRRSDAKVPVKVVIVDEVRPDGLEIDKHVVELLEDEESTSHTLSAGDGVALRGRSTDHLEEVLSDAHVVLLVT